MGNELYDENKRLKTENAQLKVAIRDIKEQRDKTAEQNFADMLTGIAGLLSGKALIYVGEVPCQVRWMHQPAVPTETVTS